MSGLVRDIVCEHEVLRSAIAPSQLGVLDRWAANRLRDGLGRFKRETGRSVLHQLVSTSRVSELEVVLASPFPFDADAALVDVSHGATVLGLAAELGDAAAVRVLLAAGAPTDRVRGEAEAPVVRAVRAGQLATVRLLPVRGPEALSAAMQAMQSAPAECWAVFVDVAGRSNPNTPTGTGCQALLEAVERGLPACAEWLLRHVPTLDVNNGFVERSPLAAACSAGHVGVVKLLLGSAAALDVNWAGAAAASPPPLHAAVRNGHDAIVRLLLADGRTCTAATDGPTQRPLVHTAAHHAARLQRPELLRCLLGTKGVDWGATDSLGRTAAHSLLLEPPIGPAARTVLMLLVRMAPLSVDGLSVFGDNALTACVRMNWPGDVLLELLGRSRAYFTRSVHEHPALLHAAAGHGNIRVCMVLVACGFSLGVVRGGPTPAIVAANAGHLVLSGVLGVIEGMPPLQRAVLAGLGKRQLNREISTGAIRPPFNLPWVPWESLMQRPPAAAPASYIALLQATSGMGWFRTVHHSFPTCFQTAAWVLLLCQHRLKGKGLPMEMSHAILAMLPRAGCCMH